MKRVIYYNQMGSVSGMQWFNIYGLTSVTHHIKKLRNKNYMITPIDREKDFERIHHPFI